MEESVKYGGLGALGGLLIGFVLGFVPEHTANGNLNHEVEQRKEANASVKSSLDRTEGNLDLNLFTVRAAQLYFDAEKNNYSSASTEASSLFTDVRSYVDRSANQSVKDQLKQVLGTRDFTIAALAKADPAVKQQLQSIFEKLHSIDSQFAGSK